MRSSLIIISFFLLLSLHGVAQPTERIDSLLKVLEVVEEDTAKVDLYNKIAWSYRNSDLKQVEKYAKKALLLGLKIDYKEGLISTYFNTGNMYYINGDYPNTLENYIKAAEILEKTTNKKGIANAWMGIGNVHAAQGNNEEALTYQHKALTLREEIGDSLDIAGSYNNIGMIYMEMEEYDDALDYMVKSMKIKEGLGKKGSLSSSYGNIGGIYMALDELEKALEYQMKALEIRQELGNKKGMCISFNDIGNIHRGLGNIDLALHNLNKALSLGREVSYSKGIATALESLSEVYEEQGNHAQSLEKYKEYTAFKDSLYTLKKVAEIAKIEEQYEGEKKDREIEVLNEKKRMLEENAQKDKMIKTLLVSAFLIVIIAALFLYRSIVEKRKAYKTISFQKQIVDETNEELNQINEELSAQRDEIEEQNNLINYKNQQLLESIQYAQRIQRAILENEYELDQTKLEYFKIFKPKDIVSGDFYWSKLIGDYFYLAVVDCTGHGVPGAFMSMLGVAFLNEIASAGILSTNDILDSLREKVIAVLKQRGSQFSSSDGMDMSLVRLDLQTGEMQYSGAMNPIYLCREGEIEEIKADRRGIGFSRDMKPYNLNTLQLNKGEQVFLFSDGYADQFGGAKDKKIGYKNFRKWLVESSSLETGKQQEYLTEKFTSWKSHQDQVDDVTLIGIRR